MTQVRSERSIILIILDGWGYSTKYHGNAIKQAYTPTLDALWHNYPSTLLHASENHVGLPRQQMGNSEVGHATIGAGRSIDQALVRIDKSISAGIFFKNKSMHSIYKSAQDNNKKIHLIGLCSNGGVHSHVNHLIALIEVGKLYINVETCIHIITDGRDTNPQSANIFINLICQSIEGLPNIQICTISGRYYSMDRDCRWQRTMQAYKCLTCHNICSQYEGDPLKVIENYYRKDIYDEFIVPTRIKQGTIEQGDGIIFFNFRPDRMRQLAQALCSDSFEGFKRKKVQNIHAITFTEYDNNLNADVIFRKVINKNFLGKVISEEGFKQFRLGETEKYAHVTYFFNGGHETPFPGEYRELVASPRVDTYDLTPRMSAEYVTEKLIKAINGKLYRLIVANYANADMVGHTGKLKATREAVEAIDRSINTLLKNIGKDKEIKIIVTADHGNADIMLDQNNEPYTSHTRNLVPFIFMNTISGFQKTKLEKKIQLEKGSLADIAPTILNILGIAQPQDMKGKPLVKKLRL